MRVRRFVLFCWLCGWTASTPILLVLQALHFSTGAYACLRALMTSDIEYRIICTFLYNGTISTKITRNGTAILTKDVYVGGYTVAHPELCSRGSLRLIILIASAPAHFAARNAVRLTWGHFARRNDVAIAFVLGQPPQTHRAALEAEDTLYGDLIMGNFVDTYSNLTLKTLFMLEWASSYCRAPFLLKTDDDMFINIPLLLDFLAEPHRASATKTIWGKYPASDIPSFTLGPAYVMTLDCASLLLAAAADRAYVRLEDVFVSGVLAQAVGIERRDSPRFFNRTLSPPVSPCVVQSTIAILTNHHKELFGLWNNLFHTCVQDHGFTTCKAEWKKPQ